MRPISYVYAPAVALTRGARVRASSYRLMVMLGTALGASTALMLVVTAARFAMARVPLWILIPVVAAAVFWRARKFYRSGGDLRDLVDLQADEQSFSKSKPGYSPPKPSRKPRHPDDGPDGERL